MFLDLTGFDTTTTNSKNSSLENSIENRLQIVATLYNKKGCTYFPAGYPRITFAYWKLPW